MPSGRLYVECYFTGCSAFNPVCRAPPENTRHTKGVRHTDHYAEHLKNRLGTLKVLGIHIINHLAYSWCSTKFLPCVPCGRS